MKTLLYHGRIHTMDGETPAAEAVLMEDGRFIAVGKDEELLPLCHDGDRTMDLQGAAVYPGLTDSHLHILNFAITSRELTLHSVRSREAALEAIRRQAEKLPEGSWLDGRGFNEDLWEDHRLITRRDLDLAAPRHGVRLTRVCGHMVIANSRAMEMAGITPETPVPEGGKADPEQGIFSENAIGLLFSSRGDRGVEACKELLSVGMEQAADAGLTAIFSDDFGTGGFSMHTVAEAYRELEREGKMPLRVVEQCALPDESAFREFLDAGFFFGQGSDFFRIGPRKLYADGSLGARTAWLSVPYADTGKGQGVPIYTQEELNLLAVQSHRAKTPFIVHAIGDAAADSVLKAIAYARAAVPGTNELRDGIVHCQITTPALLKKIRDMGVCVYAQPVFCEYDLHICRDRVGAELEKSSYQWKTLLRGGVCISSGSDSPVEPFAPAKNIYCAVTRKDFDRLPEGGWLPEQCLTVEEAIACHTVQAARAVGMEDRLGKIRPGYLADLTVFPRELEAMPGDEILLQKPLMTVVGGRIRKCPEA